MLALVKPRSGCVQDLSQLVQMISLGVRISEHSFEVIGTLIEGPREHQLMVQQTLPGVQ